MLNYAVYETEPFGELLLSLDNSDRQWIEKTKIKLAENPTGKPIRFSWFREKKYLNKRLFYLVDDETKKLLLIDFCSKKDQQRVIDEIVAHMNEFLLYLKNL